jgi:hypothetical protein
LALDLHLDPGAVEIRRSDLRGRGGSVESAVLVDADTTVQDMD